MVVGLLAPAYGWTSPNPFQQRIGAANFMQKTPQGAAYAQGFTPLVQAAIQSCIPPGTKPPGSLGTFIFVANVTKVGEISAADVQPRSTVAACFAANFAQNHLPPPPLPADARIDYPIVVEVDVTP
jgi:hypothetical protein